jgi:hypothetical protein
MRKIIIGFVLLTFHYLTIAQALDPGTISSDQQLCYGTAPQALTQTPASGGTPAYRYQWQRSNDNGIHWSNIYRAAKVTYSLPLLVKTAMFRRRVTDAANTVLYTNAVTITVSAPLKAGTIGSAQTICAGMAPFALSELQGQGASGGSGSYSYQWQNSPDGLYWSNINGATSALFAPSSLTADTWYRRLVIDGSCGSTASNSVKITLYPQITSAQLHDNITIDENTSTNFNVAISGGTTPYTVNFTRNGIAQPAVNNYISGTNISTGVLTVGVYTYTLTSVTDANGCAAQNLGTNITVTVNEALTAGTIGTSQTICNNTSPAPLTQVIAPTGGTGIYTYQWQSSPDNSVWTDIAGAILPGYSPLALSINTYFRRTVTSGSYPPVYCTPVLISLFPPISSAQFHENISIGYGSSTNLNVIISGGTSPYLINYTRNGVAQTPVSNYSSGADISTGPLLTGIYTYSLTSVTDANGCANTQNLGTEIIVTVLADWKFDFTYADRSSLLTDGWDFIAKTALGISRNTEQTSGAVVSYDQQVHPGVLRIPVDEGDLWQNYNNTRNTLFRDLPSNWRSVRLMISSFDPTQGYQQAGIAVYQDDDNYIQITRMFGSGHFNCVSFASEVNTNAANLTWISESATTNLYFRLDRNPATEDISSYYSLNGSDWIWCGTKKQSLSNPRLVVLTGASPSGFPDADIAWAEVNTQSSQITDELRAFPKTLVFNAIQGQSINDTRSIFISSANGANIIWNQATDVSWINADLQSGVTEGVLKVAVNSSDLASGIHHGNIILESTQSNAGPVIIPVTIIINPNVPVKATTWKNGKDGAMSVSVDDGQGSGFNELLANGFQGTYVYNGTVPPPFYTDYYNAGMELGSHLVHHICELPPNYGAEEIEPSISGICTNTPQPCKDVITLVWPCGSTSRQIQTVASEYFLSARGYNINQLEDATPDNFMNLKSFNSHQHAPYPPADLKTVVDMAVSQKKWFNLVLHEISNDDGAINYASSQSMWVTSIGNVIKYILQRDRFVLTNYNTSDFSITFDASRLLIPSSSLKNFEEALGPNDSTTLQIDIDDARIIDNVLVDGIITPYKSMDINGNIVLLTNVRLEPSKSHAVEIKYYNEALPHINLNTKNLSFETLIGTNPSDQSFSISSNMPEAVSWTVDVGSSQPLWLSVNPISGTGNGTIIVTVNSQELPVGTYSKTITVASSTAVNSPQTLNVTLRVGTPILTVSPGTLNFVATINNAPPQNQNIIITNSGIGGVLNWNSNVDVSWITLTPQSDVTPGEITVSVNQAGLLAGTYNGTITVSSAGVPNSPQSVHVTVTVYPEDQLHYDFNYKDRNELLSNGWDFIARTASDNPRNTEQTVGAVVSYDQEVHPGVLRIPADLGDLWANYNDTRNSLFRDLNSNWISIRLKISSFDPSQDYQQAGLVVYQNDNNYVQITRIFARSNCITFAAEVNANASILNSVSEIASANLYFRLDRDQSTETITSYYSLDGITWTLMGSVIQSLNNPRLGIIVGSSPSGFPNADIAWAEILYDNSNSKGLGNSTQKNNPERLIVLPEITNKLYQNYPNPFYLNTSISYDLAEDSNVHLELFDSFGHKLETIQNQYMSSGSYKFVWNSDEYSAGIYYLTMKTGVYRSTIKMILLK